MWFILGFISVLIMGDGTDNITVHFAQGLSELIVGGIMFTAALLMYFFTEHEDW